MKKGPFTISPLSKVAIAASVLLSLLVMAPGADAGKKSRAKAVQAVLALADVTDNSDSPRADLGYTMRVALRRYLDSQPEMVVVERPDRLPAREKARTHKPKPFQVLASLTSLKKSRVDSNVVWEAAVSLTILDHPGKTIRMVLNNRVSVSTPAVKHSKRRSSEIQNTAIDAAIKALCLRLARSIKDI